MDLFNFEHFYVPPTPQLIQSERAQIDERISQLELAVVLLKRRRNFLSPVSRLASDILLDIFECIQYDEGDESFDVTYPRRRALSPLSPRSWIRALTHVCAGWRKLALDTATLWTNITFRSNSVLYATAMLKRVRGAPLSIILSPEIGLQEANYALFWNVLKPEMHRIRTLDIHASFTWYDQHLEELQISSNLETFSVSTIPHGRVVTLPIRLLQQSSNTLRFLRIASVEFDTRDFNEVIELPLLSKIALEGQATRCAELLTKISIPLSCTVALLCWDYNAEYQSLKPFLTQFFQSWGAVGRRLSYLEFPSRHTFAFSFSESLDDPAKTLTVELVYTSGQRFIQNVLPPVALSHPTSISICASKYFEVWEYVGQTSRDVDTLSLSFLKDCIAIWNGLYIQRHHRKPYRLGKRDLPVVFPKLTTLKLHQLRLKRDSAASLRRVVISRSKAGIPLQTLQLTDTWGFARNFPRKIESYVGGSVDVCYSEDVESAGSEEVESSDSSPGDLW